MNGFRPPQFLLTLKRDEFHGLFRGNVTKNSATEFLVCRHPIVGKADFVSVENREKKIQEIAISWNDLLATPHSGISSAPKVLGPDLKSKGNMLGQLSGSQENDLCLTLSGPAVSSIRQSRSTSRS